MKTSLFNLIKKDIKVLLRSKTSSIIVILGPLLLIFLAGIAFDNTNLYRLDIGTFSESYNEMSESFIEKLTQSGIKVTRFPDEQACVNSIKEGTSHTCVIFSPDFVIGEEGKNKIDFYVDPSRINLVYMVMETISEKLSARTEEVSLELTSQLAKALESIDQEVGSKRAVIMDLTTQNDDISNAIDSIYNDMNSLDLDIGSTNVSTANLTSSKNKMKNQVSGLEDITDDSLTELDNLIEDILDYVESSSMDQSDKDSISAILNESDSELEDLMDEYDSNVNVTDSTILQLESSITAISSGFEDAKNKIADAAEVKSASLADLNEVQSMLDDALTNIAQLQNSFNNMQNSIDDIKIIDPATIVSPVETTVTPVAIEKSHLNFLFPILIILVIMFTSILLSSTLVMLERKSSSYFRNFMTPTKDITFMFSTFCTCFILLFLQLVVIILISLFFFGTKIIYTLPWAIVVLLAAISLFNLLGMFVGYLFNSQTTATLGAITIGSIFLFVSDVILPLESMPQYILNIARYNPFVLGGSLLRRTILFGVSFKSIYSDLLILIAYVVVVLFLVLLTQYISNRLYIFRYVRKIIPKKQTKAKNK